MRDRAKELGIDTSHFLPYTSRDFRCTKCGEVFPTIGLLGGHHSRIHGSMSAKWSNPTRLRRSTRKCEGCRRTTWGGKPITLQIHHIDGNTRNNEISNLQVLCPNCHSQTPNWGAKNIRRKPLTGTDSNCQSPG